MNVARKEHPDHQAWSVAMEKDAVNLERLRAMVADRLTEGEQVVGPEWSDHQHEMDEDRERDPAWAAWCFVTVTRGDREGQGYCELSDARDLEGKALGAYLEEQADFLLEQAREGLG